MPELAELKLTADFINKNTKDRIFHSVWKNPVHKGNDIKIGFPFSIEAFSRGKELMLQISTGSVFATEGNMEFLPLMMTTKKTVFVSLTSGDLANGDLAGGIQTEVQILRKTMYLL